MFLSYAAFSMGLEVNLHREKAGFSHQAWSLLLRRREAEMSGHGWVSATWKHSESLKHQHTSRLVIFLICIFRFRGKRSLKFLGINEPVKSSWWQIELQFRKAFSSMSYVCGRWSQNTKLRNCSPLSSSLTQIPTFPEHSEEFAIHRAPSCPVPVFYLADHSFA